jgi:transcriptional regulator with XRE-family HTH domain
MRVIERTIKVKVVDHEATGAAVRARRRKSNMTLKDLAERAGLSPSFMSALERGDRVWTQHLLDQVDLALRGYWVKYPEGRK